MKVYVDSDEYYPFYEMRLGGSMEVSEEFFARYTKVMADFETLQNELRALDPDGGGCYGTTFNSLLDRLRNENS